MKMGLPQSTRDKLQAQIDALKKRMQIDSNDLDYETHLHTVRTLQKILDRQENENEGNDEAKNN